MKRQADVINQLANRIEQCDEVRMKAHKRGMGPAFTMLQASYSCGSPACILGHAHGMLHKTTTSIAKYYYRTFAADLGIHADKALELYAPINEFASFLAGPSNPRWITKAHAVAVLRHLADTGEVDWRIGKEKI